MGSSGSSGLVVVGCGQNGGFMVDIGGFWAWILELRPPTQLRWSEVVNFSEVT